LFYAIKIYFLSFLPVAGGLARKASLSERSQLSGDPPSTSDPVP